jgi:hypothetical protein
MERDRRIELLTKPWQGFEIPLHQSRGILAGKPGLEPGTDRLTADCSTTELYANIFF